MAPFPDTKGIKKREAGHCMVSALPRRNRWIASFFSLGSFPIPAPARGRRVLPALPSRIISPSKSTHCFDNKLPSSYCLGQWTRDMNPGLKEPRSISTIQGLAGNAESQAPISDGLTEPACEQDPR